MRDGKLTSISKIIIHGRARQKQTIPDVLRLLVDLNNSATMEIFVKVTKKETRNVEIVCQKRYGIIARRATEIAIKSYLIHEISP